MIKTGIINKKTDIQKIENEEDLEKFAEKSEEQIKKANEEFIKRCQNKEGECEK